jgi:hypothetical protein
MKPILGKVGHSKVRRKKGRKTDLKRSKSGEEEGKGGELEEIRDFAT